MCGLGGGRELNPHTTILVPPDQILREIWSPGPNLSEENGPCMRNLVPPPPHPRTTMLSSCYNIPYKPTTACKATLRVNYAESEGEREQQGRKGAGRVCTCIYTCKYLAYKLLQHCPPKFLLKDRELYDKIENGKLGVDISKTSCLQIGPIVASYVTMTHCFFSTTGNQLFGPPCLTLADHFFSAKRNGPFNVNITCTIWWWKREDQIIDHCWWDWIWSGRGGGISEGTKFGVTDPV